jgi:hypothetical protein
MRRPPSPAKPTLALATRPTGAYEAYNLEATTYRVHQAWTGKSLGKLNSVENLALEPHASTLWILRK